MSELYPLLFRPTLKTVVWGGHRLQPYKGLTSTNEPIGESWEVSAVSGSESIVANGKYAGVPLPELIERFPAEILGEKTVEKHLRKGNGMLIVSVDCGNRELHKKIKQVDTFDSVWKNIATVLN